MSHHRPTTQGGCLRRVCRAAALTSWACWLGLWGVTGSAKAGIDLKNVADPTRPPPGMYRPVRGGPSDIAAAPAAAASLGASDAAPAAVAPPPRKMRLQAVRHNGAFGGGVAMIDGELIELGGRVAGGWTLTAMNSDEVWLTGPAGQRRLTLMGDDTSTDKPRAAKARRARKE